MEPMTENEVIKAFILPVSLPLFDITADSIHISTAKTDRHMVTINGFLVLSATRRSITPTKNGSIIINK